MEHRLPVAVLHRCSVAVYRDGTRRHGDSLLTCGNDTSWHKPNPDDMTGFGLLIRGFGVRVPGGALITGL
jgi:hypothetical protein